jgi:PTS system nitrogen regulatory IIA component
MKIADLLRKEYIIEDLCAKNKKDVLAELSAIFLQGDMKVDRDAVVNVLLEREKLGSTGIGDGIAIPHGKHGDIDDLIVSFGKSKAGVDFNAMDGKPVHLFFLLMAPESTTGQHLKILAKISRMLKDSKFRENLIEAKSKDDLYRLIAERDDAC